MVGFIIPNEGQLFLDGILGGSVGCGATALDSHNLNLIQPSKIPPGPLNFHELLDPKMTKD